MVMIGMTLRARYLATELDRPRMLIVRLNTPP